MQCLYIDCGCFLVTNVFALVLIFLNVILDTIFFDYQGFYDTPTSFLNWGLRANPSLTSSESWHRNGISVTS